MSKYRLDVPVDWELGYAGEQQLKHLSLAVDKARELGVPLGAQVTVKKSPLGGVSKLRFRWSS